MQVIKIFSLNTLFDVLKQNKYQVVGPTIQENSIVYDIIESIDDLPIGWTDEQDGGKYRIKKNNDNLLLNFVVGHTSLKKFIYPPKTKLWQARGNKNSFEVIEEKERASKIAFFGIRSCDLHALAIQDKIFLEGEFIDLVYKARREKAFIIAVNCGKAAKTCFCTSMNTGPKATSGFDLLLTEIMENSHHYFVIEIGSKKGREIIKEIPHQVANSAEIDASIKVVKNAESQITRTMNLQGIKKLLYENFEHPRWDDVANRCLACGNCTMVCPTCFCSTVEDITDLAGTSAERWRMWDSCFTADFSYIHGGIIRSSTKSRYRQWITHKLGSWQDQFESSGCVGCGRCITWCPVGIDITEEIKVVRENQTSEVNCS